MIEWRRFVVETLICFELMAVIAVVGFDASHDVFAAAGVGGLAAAALRILWRR